MPDHLHPDASGAIFLSYASEDASAARQIAEILGAAGLTVWFDQSELRGGDAWDQQIRRQIRECALFVPVISANTQARAEGYFRLEWHLAEQRSYLMAHDKAFIVPVVVDQTPDAGARVPDRFRERQWTRFLGGNIPADFAHRVAQLLGRGPAPLPAAPERARSVPLPAPNFERSVAILAFANLSGDQENEYFSDGISDELLTVLQNIPGLRVAARTSAFSFKGKNATARDIGALLNVAHLVEGGVQKSGNRVKVAVRLTNVDTGEVKWSRSYTRELQDVFALQEELALAIVGELRGRLVGDEAALVQLASRGGTRNPEAYENYLLGKHLHDQSSPDSVARGTEHMRKATALDPNFALAWVRLAEALIWRCSFGGDVSREQFSDLLAEGRRAVDRALALEPDLGAALAARAWIELGFDFNLKASLATMRYAEAVDPNEPEVLLMNVLLLCIKDDASESLALCQRLVAMDPINPRRHIELAAAYAECGRFEEARSAAARNSELRPTGMFAPLAVANMFALEGRYAEAERAMGSGASGWSKLWLDAIIRAGLGRMNESDAALEELMQLFSSTAAVQIASIYAVRNQSDLAFEWLERAYQQNDAGLITMYRSHFFAPIKEDQRWKAFWTKVGLVQYQ